jgi:alpha-mannosidase
LWPLRETRRKGGRTFATAIDSMGKYPEYLFGASQPQLYDWVKEDYPLLYDKVKKAYSDGRWELLGAMWAEPDLNLISGESVIRQILYGNAYWKKEFGQTVNFVWTPDTFGYSAYFVEKDWYDNERT